MSIHRIGWLLASVGMVVVVWLAGYGLVVGEGAKGAVVWCTRPDGASGCQTTIQAAVDLASDGDGVLIAGGVYTENVVITKSLVMTGGWVPAGWTITETIIQANGAGCALDWVGGSGRVSDMTVMGGAPAGLCANQVSHLHLQRLNSHSNLGDGLLMTTTEHITVSNSLVTDNGRHGINLSCMYGTPTSTTYFITNTVVSRNSENGVSGSYYVCDYQFHNSQFTQNTIGLADFFGDCPLITLQRYLTYTQETATNIIVNNNDIGIRTECGATIQLKKSLVTSNRIGLNAQGGAFRTQNSLIVGNSEMGVHMESGGWRSQNDTIADNGLAIQLNDTGFGCYGWSYFVYLRLTNTIIEGDWTWTYQEGCPPPTDPYFYIVEAEYSLLSFLPMMTDVPYVGFMFGEGVSDVPAYFGAGYVPQIPSLAIDGGTSVGAPLVDFYDTPRPVDGDGDGVAKIDIGAVEAPTGTIYHTYHPLIPNP